MATAFPTPMPWVNHWPNLALTPISGFLPLEPLEVEPVPVSAPLMSCLDTLLAGLAVPIVLPANLPGLGGKLAGVLSLRDLTRALRGDSHKLHAAARTFDPRTLKVGPDVNALGSLLLHAPTAGTSVREVMQLFLANKRGLFIVDAEGRPQSRISLASLISKLLEWYSQHYPSAKTSSSDFLSGRRICDVTRFPHSDQQVSSPPETLLLTLVQKWFCKRQRARLIVRDGTEEIAGVLTPAIVLRELFELQVKYLTTGQGIGPSNLPPLTSATVADIETSWAPVDSVLFLEVGQTFGYVPSPASAPEATVLHLLLEHGFAFVREDDRVVGTLEITRLYHDLIAPAIMLS